MQRWQSRASLHLCQQPASWLRIGTGPRLAQGRQAAIAWLSLRLSVNALKRATDRSLEYFSLLRRRAPALVLGRSLVLRAAEDCTSSPAGSLVHQRVLVLLAAPAALMLLPTTLLLPAARSLAGAATTLSALATRSHCRMRWSASVGSVSKRQAIIHASCPRFRVCVKRMHGQHA